MNDSRNYPDRYDRYAASESETDSGQVTLSYPGTATASSQPCRFNPKGGKWSRKDEGLTFNYDAQLRVPESATVLPAKRGDNADKIVVTLFNGGTISRTFQVIDVYSAWGQHKHVFLKELQP